MSHPEGPEQLEFCSQTYLCNLIPTGKINLIIPYFIVSFKVLRAVTLKCSLLDCEAVQPGRNLLTC